MKNPVSNIHFTACVIFIVMDRKYGQIPFFQPKSCGAYSILNKLKALICFYHCVLLLNKEMICIDSTTIKKKAP